MTPEQLSDLARHLPAGTTISISLTISGPDDLPEDATDPPEPEAPDPDATPDGGPWRKVKQAAARAGLPRRELKRAIDADFLGVRVKEDGRDAGAHMLHDDDVDVYARRRQAILEFREDPPEGWPGPGGE